MKHIVLTIILTLAVATVAFAVVYRGYKSTNSATTPLTVTVVQVDCRPTLTRVTARLVGRPHTSQRVDSVVLKVGNRRLTATDVDGIDFKRWFQWEDDGVIEVEIDFPKVALGRGSFVLETATPRGVAKTTVTR